MCVVRGAWAHSLGRLGAPAMGALALLAQNAGEGGLAGCETQAALV